MIKTRKPIPGFEVYEITEDGKIFSVPRILSDGRTWAGGLRKLCEDRNGYLYVDLYKDGQHFNKQVHRLVLETFVGPCPDGMECRHLNGNPSDNRLQNLSWGTKSENAVDAVRHGTSSCWKRGHRGGAGEKNTQAKLSETDVRWIAFLSNGGVSGKELSEIFHVSRATVSNISNKRSWKYIWSYCGQMG